METLIWMSVVGVFLVAGLFAGARKLWGYLVDQGRRDKGNRGR